MQVTILQDYKNRFETKFTSVPYRSGMDKNLLSKSLRDLGVEVDFIHYMNIDFRDPFLKDKVFLYCSSEDNQSRYKAYIEDIVLGLSEAGAMVIPEFKYIRAHNNKVFMEILRDTSNDISIQNISSKYFGTLEELVKYGNQLEFPCVIKPAEGSMSKGVYLVSDFADLVNKAKRIGRSRDIKNELKDYVRARKHKGYIKESFFRNKFIIQNFVKHLDGDWKVLVYGNKFYPISRKNRENDFRASGGGRLTYIKSIPDGLLDFARGIYRLFNTPNISLDIGFNGKEFYLIEFQTLYFGTYTIEHSEFYFMNEGEKWFRIDERSILEKEYARSIYEYLKLERQVVSV